ncbi:MAG: response regulator, partial [Sulfurimonas sp.]|nr:response regulator [Sulfurimonas sp.]
MSVIKKLKSEAKDISVLYAEDNKALRENASKLLGKFFTNVYSGVDGKDALEQFKKYHPQIVITDLNMPNMDGLSFAKHAKHILPDTKIIIMSAFDDKDHLHKAIELGVFRFLTKPVNLSKLTDVLYQAVEQIHHENNTKLFYMHLKDIFNYQSSMILMLKDKKLIIANQAFLNFFKVGDLSEFRDEHHDLGTHFLAHNGFLYNKLDKNWLDEVSENEQKLYHVKLKNSSDEIRHFILKYQKIKDKKGYGILSLDDLTELNLLKLFDEKRVKSDENLQDRESMFKLLKVIQRNSAKVELHNYYKGLSITNDAIISEVKNESVVVKTTYMQEKAVQYERRSVIVSEALPNAIACDEIVKIGFDDQSIEFKKLHFSSTSPTQRSTIRVIPEEKHTVSLFLGENKFQGEAYIEDISLDAVRLRLNALPAGLAENDEVHIDMVLTMDRKPLIISSKAIMFRKSESKYSFDVVFTFQFADNEKSKLVKYIT